MYCSFSADAKVSSKPEPSVARKDSAQFSPPRCAEVRFSKEIASKVEDMTDPDKLRILRRAITASINIQELQKALVQITDEKSAPISAFQAKTTSSTAQGGGGSFKNRKPIGEIGCCEQKH